MLSRRPAFQGAIPKNTRYCFIYIALSTIFATHVWATEEIPTRDITVVNGTGRFRILVRYTNEKDQTSIDPLDIGASHLLKVNSQKPIFYSVGDFTDKIFTATPDLFFGTVLTIKIPKEIQDILDRVTLTVETSVGDRTAEKVVSQLPYTPPSPKQNEVVHQPFVVPLQPAQSIRYTYPGMGVNIQR